MMEITDEDGALCDDPHAAQCHHLSSSASSSRSSELQSWHKMTEVISSDGRGVDEALGKNSDKKKKHETNQNVNGNPNRISRHKGGIMCSTDESVQSPSPTISWSFYKMFPGVL